MRPLRAVAVAAVAVAGFLVVGAASAARAGRSRCEALGLRGAEPPGRVGADDRIARSRHRGRRLRHRCLPSRPRRTRSCPGTTSSTKTPTRDPPVDGHGTAVAGGCSRACRATASVASARASPAACHSTPACVGPERHRVQHRHRRGHRLRRRPRGGRRQREPRTARTRRPSSEAAVSPGTRGRRARRRRGRQRGARQRRSIPAAFPEAISVAASATSSGRARELLQPRLLGEVRRARVRADRAARRRIRESAAGRRSRRRSSPGSSRSFARRLPSRPQTTSTLALARTARAVPGTRVRRAGRRCRAPRSRQPANLVYGPSLLGDAVGRERARRPSAASGSAPASDVALPVGALPRRRCALRSPTRLVPRYRPTAADDRRTDSASWSLRRDRARPHPRRPRAVESRPRLSRRLPRSSARPASAPGWSRCDSDAGQARTSGSKCPGSAAGRRASDVATGPLVSRALDAIAAIGSEVGSSGVELGRDFSAALSAPTRVVR